jgi:hypothetical protein
MLRRWGIPWYAIGIGGTIVFIAIWIITRMPGNPITGRGGPAGNPIAIAIEVLQGAFIGLAAAIIVYEGREKKKQLQSQERKTTSEKTEGNGKARMPILAGAVVALILIGLFALPILMPSPMGGGRPPPSAAGQFGPPEQF